MHGLGISSQLFRGGGFNEVSQALQQSGIRAVFRQVPPYQPIGKRAAGWQAHIEELLAQVGADRINLIAFSAGGLDARYGIATSWDASRIASLVTVSSPHGGTALSPAFKRLDSGLGHVITRRMDTLSHKYFPDATSEAVSAIEEMTPDRLRARFSSFPDPPEEIRCLSVAAMAGKGTGTHITPLLIPGNRILYRHEGPNDGFVSASSAVWGDFLGSVCADHAQLYGIPFARRSFDIKRFYHSLCYLLADMGC